MKKMLMVSLLTIIFLLVYQGIPMVYAAPPVNPTTQISDNTLEIETPPLTYIKFGEDHRFHAHVINDTKVKTNLTTTCYLHLYNKTGYDLNTSPTGLMEWESYNGIDFAYTVAANNFSYIGTYAYVIQCNSSNEVGFVAGTLEVTQTGMENATDNRVGIYFILAIMILCFVGFIYIQKDVYKWTFFLMFLFFLMIGVNLISISYYNEVGDLGISKVFDQISAISIIFYWFIGGILLVIWILSTIAGLADRKRMRQAEQTGGKTDFKFT